MGKIKISVVKYANSYPFVWGLSRSRLSGLAQIETDHPVVCAEKLKSGSADIGLIPVAAIPEVPGYRIISDYCIGACRKVKTVLLLSNSEFDEIDTVYLDYRSRSSVALARVLARHKWKKDFRWIPTGEGFAFTEIKKKEAVVLIGDQCFELESSFSYGLDLAEEWKDFTGLCFVFACWVSNREIPPDFISEFNSALKYGVDNKEEVSRHFGGSGVMSREELHNYLNNNIDYILDAEKRESMKIFLDLIKKTNER